MSRLVGIWQWSNGSQSGKLTVKSDHSFFFGEGCKNSACGEVTVVSGSQKIPKALTDKFGMNTEYLKFKLDPDRSYGSYDPSAEYSDRKTTIYYHPSFKSSTDVELTEARYNQISGEHELETLTYTKQ